MTSQFTSDISSEFSDAADPLKGAKDDYEGIKGDLKKAGTALTGYTTMPGVDEMPSVDKKLPLPPVPADSAHPATGDENDTGELEIPNEGEAAE